MNNAPRRLERLSRYATRIARSLGCTLRHFADAASALTWLYRR